MDVYLDVVVLQNLVWNYLILLLTSKIVKSKASNLRLLVGAALGAGYVVVLITMPGLKAYQSIGAKLLLSLVIIAVTFGPEKPIYFFKLLAVFYCSTFIFAGAAFAVIFFNLAGGFVKNGIYINFIESSWTWGLPAVILVAVIARILFETLKVNSIGERLLIPLRISVESRMVGIRALLDTGNSLHDPLSNLPVVVVEFTAIRDLLPFEMQEIFERSVDQDLGMISHIMSSSSWQSRFRIIPFNSLGKTNGMLLGFKPDFIEVGDEEDMKGVSDVIVGIYNSPLSKNDQYKALLNPEIF